MANTTLDSLSRTLSSIRRLFRTQTREEELRQATVNETAKKVELQKILDAERELTKARADNDQLRKAIEAERSARVGMVQGGQGSKTAPVKPKRTI